MTLMSILRSFLILNPFSRLQIPHWVLGSWWKPNEYHIEF